MSLLTSKYGPPTLVRKENQLTGSCDACHEDVPKQDPRALFVEITFENRAEVTLCPRCELNLLSALLNNYVKRAKKGKETRHLFKEKEEKSSGN